jgi:RNA polymerase sigma factor (sigma-70 family)
MMLELVRAFLRRAKHLPGRVKGLPGPARAMVLLAGVLCYGTTGFLYFELPAKGELRWSDALWWSAVTLTTVGYGDVYPSTDGGRYLVAVPLMVIGIGLLGYVLSLAARLGIPLAEVDDAAQEALEHIWRASDRAGPTNKPGWEIRVAANRLLDFLRGVRRRHRWEDIVAFDDDVRDEGEDPEACAISRRRIKILGGLIAQIGPSGREIFIEHELQGVPLDEIASKEGISLDAAKKRLCRARRELERARDRWQTEQRRKGHDTRPAIVPLGFSAFQK